MIARLKAHSGVLLPLAALVLWGIWAFLPKLAMQSMQPHSILFYESFGGAMAVLPLLFFNKGGLVRDKKGVSLLFCGSCLSITGILCYYTALKAGSVATVTTVTAMYPVVVMALARIFLREELNRWQWLAAALAMVSVYLLAG
ncbi:MAG: DMT family transporter [Alphaproteobacteria bacterium]|nr:DMT family transporter [Alphaproteobacteria bacterium]MDE2336091.1 DMT family transporter [Alphaproteobacteria bacterium]